MIDCVVGFLCNCVLPVTLNSTKVRHHHRIEDKQQQCEGEKQALTSEPNKLTASNSTSSSSSPAYTSGLRRGRSRTRRALPPSSPLIVESSNSNSSWCPKYEKIYYFTFFFSLFVLFCANFTEIALTNKERATYSMIFNSKLLLFILYIQWLYHNKKTSMESRIHTAFLFSSLRGDPPLMWGIQKNWKKFLKLRSKPRIDQKKKEANQGSKIMKLDTSD